jgi:hypothetical protein
METTQKIFCDKHPLTPMDRVNFSNATESTSGFKCSQCNRVFLGTDWGYCDYIDRGLRRDSHSQWRCLIHKSPMALGAFEFQGDESIRGWICALWGCQDIQLTIGEYCRINN